MGRARMLMLAFMITAFWGLYGCGAEPLDQMALNYYINDPIKVYDGSTESHNFDPIEITNDGKIVFTIRSRPGTQHDLHINEVRFDIYNWEGIVDDYFIAYNPRRFVPRNGGPLEITTVVFDKDWYINEFGEDFASQRNLYFSVDIRIKGSFTEGGSTDITIKDSTWFTVWSPPEEEEEEPAVP
jgi:hypothetical protein